MSWLWLFERSWMSKEKVRAELTGKADVLIIDDDKGMSYTLMRMVKESGHSAKTAFTIDEGIKLARATGWERYRRHP